MVLQKSRQAAAKRMAAQQPKRCDKRLPQQCKKPGGNVWFESAPADKTKQKKTSKTMEDREEFDEEQEYREQVLFDPLFW